MDVNPLNEILNAGITSMTATRTGKRGLISNLFTSTTHSESVKKTIAALNELDIKTLQSGGVNENLRPKINDFLSAIDKDKQNGAKLKMRFKDESAGAGAGAGGSERNRTKFLTLQTLCNPAQIAVDREAAATEAAKAAEAAEAAEAEAKAEAEAAEAQITYAAKAKAASTAANTASDAFKEEAQARQAALAAVDAASAALKAKMVRAGSGIMRYARKFQACLLPYRNIAGLAPIT
jgi:hypothetical protein